MVSERSVRRSSFQEGGRVRLSDGQSWALPARDPLGDDREYDALVSAVYEAETRAEGLRAELALTVFLLNRNYALAPDLLGVLLSFAPDDPALPALQSDVHRFVIEQAPRCLPVSSVGPQRGKARRPSTFLSPHAWADRIRSAVSYRIS